MTSPVQFGIAGWSYPDWSGIVYPRGCSDPLRFVAERVDFIEVNSTFYRVPEARITQDWVHRVQDLDTFFTAKLPQEITHQGELRPTTVQAFLEGLAPLGEADRLRVVLAQFSYAFEAEPTNFAYLRAIAEQLGGLAPIVLEVRHDSWRSQVARDVVQRVGMSLAHLDYPGSFDAAGTELYGDDGIAYFRLHGRNRKAWFAKAAGRDQKYDYEYSSSERAAIADRVTGLSEQARTATMVATNNHFHGKAMKLLLELMSWYRGDKVDVPQGMIDRYPDLRSIARFAQGGLF